MGNVSLNLLAIAGLGIAGVCSFLRRVYLEKQKGRNFPRGESEELAKEADCYGRGAFLGTDDIYLCPVGEKDVYLSRDGMMEFHCLRSLDYQKYKAGQEHDDCNDRLRFLREVYECLKMKVDSGSKLRSFCMGCCFLDECASHLHDWIQTIAGLGVEELSLGNPCDISQLVTFSFQLISGVSTLRRLDLFSCHIAPGFIGHCNSIASLNLDFVPLLREEISDILLFCPNLQYLTMTRCKLPRKLRIFGPDLKLEHLCLFTCSGLHELDMSAGNLVTISMNSPNNIELLLSSVPKLEYLSLVIAGTPFCFGEVPRDLPQLKFLAIQGTMQDMDEIPGISPSSEMFGNLRKLHLLIKRSSYQGACQKVDLWNFTPLLSACPRLELFTLMVEGRFDEVKKRRVQWPVLQHKHLDHVELAGFSNTRNELEFAKFILRSTQALHWLVLRTCIREYDGRCFRRYARSDPRGKISKSQAKHICSKLQRHALSKRAKVKVF